MTKENETAAAPPESTGRTASASATTNDTAAKAQPIALEIPVTVNGARTVEGSSKREPFSESTKTVLVFGNGAVIRLTSAVAPGQLLFLTNEKTKKEVVCQVVKSKNYRNVSGYVELEFTESVVGFWGMRFPGDRIGTAPPPAVSSPSAIGSNGANVVSPASATPRPAASKVEAPTANLTPRVTETKPAAAAPVVRGSEPRISESKFVAPAAPAAPAAPPTPATLTTPASLMPELAVNAIPVRPTGPVASPFDSPSAHESKASIFAPPPQAPMAPPVVNVTSLDTESDRKDSSPAPVEEMKAFSLPEIKPAAPTIFAAPPEAPTHVAAAHPAVASDPETEALKQHTARLQEQLSNLLFSETPSPKPIDEAPARLILEKPQEAEATSKVLETAYLEAQADFSEPVELAKAAPPPVKTSLDEEELKIPAWLEPLARNASAPVSTQELIEREKARRIAEQKPKVEEIIEDSLAVSTEESSQELPAPTFGTDLSFGEEQAVEAEGSKRSSKGLLIGALAAGMLLLAGGGWWYLQPQLGGVRAGTVATIPQTTRPAAAAPAPAEALQPQPQGTLPTQNNSAAPVESIPQSKPAQDLAPASTPNMSNAIVRSSVDKNGAATSKRNNEAVKLAVLQPAEPEPQPKKPALGEVRLATPTVRHRSNSQVSGDGDAELALEQDQPEANGDSVGAGLAVGSKQPVEPMAPVPVGGDVKPAKLVSSVPPVYPTLAKNQHVSGNVQVDALIDATGRVTTMKVVSGPTLLQQAAMDALKQWRYQPATLDGKPVAMHLTVTIQFRLQ